MNLGKHGERKETPAAVLPGAERPDQVGIRPRAGKGELEDAEIAQERLHRGAEARGGQTDSVLDPPLPVQDPGTAPVVMDVVGRRRALAEAAGADRALVHLPTAMPESALSPATVATVATAPPS